MAGSNQSPIHWAHDAAFELSQRIYWFQRSMAHECTAYANAVEQRSAANLMLYVMAKHRARAQWLNWCWVSFVRNN